MSLFPDLDVIPPFSKAPIPFLGQKRNFLDIFIKLLKNKSFISVVDVFGGSGLISHNVKYHFPNTSVYFNDYDNYTDRFRLIDSTNNLVKKLRYAVKTFKKKRNKTNSYFLKRGGAKSKRDNQKL